MKINELISEIAVKKLKFKGSPCTKDCSGHTAGYDWARRKNIKTPNQCPSLPNHPSFSNGCKILGREKALNKPLKR
jgi:hypothetical protein